jgi:hypothetical protein
MSGKTFKSILGGSKVMPTKLFVLLLLLQSCNEQPTKVGLTGGNPPTFSLSGSGQLDRLYIEEADAQEQPNPTPGILWEIVPQHRGQSGLEGISVDRIGKVTYGTVPEEYRQSVPSDNKPPPVLVEGRYYYFHVSTVNAPHAWGYFVIKGGKPEFARIHGNCTYDTNGQKTKGPCGEPNY